ncbi:MAG: hypothetical protein JXB00_16505 [Bacteroidales bacterium]|nr:hypothetical protein [Bacteroidales bacterium]
MERFRLPRKIKKSLKQTIWLYPPDEKDSRQMAFPASSQEDYDAVKNGIATEFPRSTKAEIKVFREMLDKEVFVTDEQLKTFVEDIFREDLRYSSYLILTEAKKNPRAIQAYFNFVNAYLLFQKGEKSYGNICCMAVDTAWELLKTKPKKNKKQR